MAEKRIAKEIQILKSNPPNPSLLNVGPVDLGNIFYWQATIIGPEGTPYENGKFLLSIQLPPDYPFKPPRMWFLTKVYHPSVYPDKGATQLNYDNVGYHNWSPAYTVQDMIMSFHDLLQNIDVNDPLRPGLA